eukprot:SAG11_NODE_3577_length_2359_cov_1.198673_2_plen_205_part_00
MPPQQQRSRSYAEKEARDALRPSLKPARAGHVTAASFPPTEHVRSSLDFAWRHQDRARLSRCAADVPEFYRAVESLLLRRSSISCAFCDHTFFVELERRRIKCMCVYFSRPQHRPRQRIIPGFMCQTGDPFGERLLLHRFLQALRALLFSDSRRVQETAVGASPSTGCVVPSIFYFLKSIDANNSDRISLYVCSPLSTTRYQRA